VSSLQVCVSTEIDGTIGRSASTQFTEVVRGHLDAVLAGDEQQVPEAAPDQGPRLGHDLVDTQRPARDVEPLAEAAVGAARQAGVADIERREQPHRPAEPLQGHRAGLLRELLEAWQRGRRQQGRQRVETGSGQREIEIEIVRGGGRRREVLGEAAGRRAHDRPRLMTGRLMTGSR